VEDCGEHFEGTFGKRDCAGSFRSGPSGTVRGIGDCGSKDISAGYTASFDLG
jgi:hypothetical protein